MKSSFNEILSDACEKSGRALKISGENLEAALAGAAFDRDTGCLDIELNMNFIMPHDIYREMRRRISECLEFVKSEKFTARYSCGEMDRAFLISQYMPYVKDRLPDIKQLLNTVDVTDPENVRIGGHTVTFKVVGESTVSELEKKNAGAEIAGIFREKFGIETEVRFCNNEQKCDEREKNRAEKSAEEMKQAALEAQKAAQAAKVRRQNEPQYDNVQGGFQGGAYGGNPSGGAYGGRPRRRRNKYEGPVRGNVVLGREIQAAPTDIKNISDDGSETVICGTVFDMDSKTTKNGRIIRTFDVTDKTDSVRVKCFVSQQKSDDIDEHIKNGKCVRFAGHTEYDTFEKMLILMADSIELAEKREREDTCPPDRKRVELHAHTKMSTVDAVMDVKDLINTAKRWGHKAVAVTDHGLVQAFPDAAEAAGDDIKVLYGCEGYLVNAEEKADGSTDYKSMPSYHIILIAKNQTGLKNLYRLVSCSYIDYFYKRPRMPRKKIEEFREGLIIGSACEAGELFTALMNGVSEEELEKVASFYDYLEIQPRTNNLFMIDNQRPKYKNVHSVEDILDLNKRVAALGEKMGKPVVATSDAHYLDPEDYIYRNIILAAHHFKDIPEEPRIWLRTTDEMLDEFSYLGREKAEEVVIDNPQKIADMVGEVHPISDEKCPPEIPGAEEKLRTHCYETAHSIYGDPLPKIVEDRLEKELGSIIKNGYAVMYVIADMLVRRSIKRGYLVGSRGSVGSSLAATMDGITEVNPLPPHYVCPECGHSEFVLDGGYDCGVDMPDKVCPECGTKYKKDGFNIPFETFLGFEGDKEPDIDLNFAGDDRKQIWNPDETEPHISSAQKEAHMDVGRIFGKDNIFKAGTIGTIQEKTAFGYVKNYFEERGRVVSPVEMKRLAMGCTGVHKSNGQHPGGIVVLPKGHEIEEFCPIMYPSSSTNKSDKNRDDEDGVKVTTHFDYHKIDKNLLKLDILGHDIPSMIRQLQDMTGVAPGDISFSDPKVNSLFLGTDALDIKIPDYKQRHGTFGIPEFGTSFTRQMLDDTQPKKFSALVRIAGFSHGTDVWLNNAQEFIRSGQATMDDAIATRDDIMNYLIGKGLPKKESFQIMEKVRKGKGLTEEREALMREHDVPEWYIESCKRIKYMFPKAHAVAYVMMSYRIAYFKVYYPAEFYAVHFTTKIDSFNADVILGGIQAVTDRMDSINRMGRDASQKDKDEYLVYEVAYEMYARGYEFLPVEFGRSRGTDFTVEDGKVRLPFRALEGMGITAAMSIEEEYRKREFSSVEDLMMRTGINSSNAETLKKHGVLDGIPESDQMSLFDFVS